MLQNDLIQKAVRTLNGRILEGWARTRETNGLLYYLNHHHGITQWDHPEYIRIFTEMNAINTVKYAAYRTAQKLRYLQTQFKFHDVSLQCVTSAFDSAGLRAAENNDIVPIKEIERVVFHIYRTSYKSKPTDLSLCSDLMINLILNTYDENRSGNIQVLKCKVLLTVMCGGRLQEKYRYLFNQIADHNNCCTRRRLAKLLQHLASITEVLSEQLSFGISLVPGAVKSCFNEIEGDIGITEDAFLAWLLQEPQTLVWWTTLYRLSSAEIVCHDIKCSVCKQHPMVGLRYQCLKCLGYNLCQDCFLHGKNSKGHKLYHPIQEYCHESTVKEWRQSIKKILMHRLRGSNNVKPRYLTISSNSGTTLMSLLQDTENEITLSRPPNLSRNLSDGSNSLDSDDQMASRTIFHSVENLSKLDNDSSDTGSSSNIDPPEPLILPSSPSQEIYSIIKQLEDGQKQLCNGNNSPQLVRQHSAVLETQINKLKTILRHYSKSSSLKDNENRALARMESTPIVGERGLFLSLSPIAPEDNLNDTAVLDNKENHYVEKRHCVISNSSEIHSNISNNSHLKRITISTISEDQQSNIAASEEEQNENIPRRGKVSNFSEVNWSDLTPSTVTPSSPNPVRLSSNNIEDGKAEIGWKAAPLLNSVVTENKGVGEELARANEDLEEVLTRLQDFIGFETRQKTSKSLAAAPTGVITASCEIGDAVANFVERLPNNIEKEDVLPPQVSPTS